MFVAFPGAEDASSLGGRRPGAISPQAPLRGRAIDSVALLFEPGKLELGKRRGGIG